MSTQASQEATIEDDDTQMMEIESLCINCQLNGVSRLMLTKIPFYKEVVVMSFHCNNCGYENNELKNCGVISEKGVKFVLKATTPKDLNRKCVRTEFAVVSIPEVDLEIFAKNQTGEVTTVEGVIDRVVTGLQQNQPERRIDHPEDAAKLDDYMMKLIRLKNVEENGPFTLIVDDISGNSHIENPLAPRSDPNLTVSYFERTTEQDHELGMFTQKEVNDTEDNANSKLKATKDTLLHPIGELEHSLEEIQHGEVLTFRTNCPDCNAPCDTNMKMTCIPHFKEVVIMATNCDSCGHRTNEVKSSGGIEEFGVKIELKIRNKEDFSRDILKSDTCTLMIPELELESGPRSLCGRFTTSEGLISSIRHQLAGDDSMFVGDSTDPDTVDRMEGIISKLDKILEGKLSVTLVLDDPAGNSYVQSMKDDGTYDDGLTITKYERNYEQREELGLNDMKTENY